MSRKGSATSSSGRSAMGKPGDAGKEDTGAASEVKAAYLAILGDVDKDVASRNELEKVLQQAGRNPSQKTVDQFWTKSTKKLTFKEVSDIICELKPTTEDDLLQAFKKIDVNGDGYITQKELMKVLTKRGDKMSEEEVDVMIAEADKDGDQKLNYKEFCKMVMSTTGKCQETSLKRLERKERKQKRAAHSADAAKKKATSASSIKKNEDSSSKKKEDSSSKKKADASGINKEESSSKKRDDSASKNREDSSSRKREDSASKNKEDSSSRKRDDSASKNKEDSSSRKRDDSASKNKEDSSSKKREDSAGKKKGDASVIKKKEDVGVVTNLPPISKQQPSLKEPINLKDWYHAHSKGCFHFDDDEKITSHQYVLEVAVTTKLWLTVKPINVGIVKASTSKPKTDINLFILKQAPDGIVGDLVAFTHVKNKEKYCFQGELQAGNYRFIPMTTGCHFRPKKRTVKEKAVLVQPKGSDECELTKVFKNALNDIFEMVDLDGNGTLSRNEFNLFQLRTSGEAVDDDAWEVVEENFELKKGELTRKGFMDLNQMEANEGFAEGGQVDDLWITLASMGFADDLVLEEACPFLVDVFTEHCPSRIRAQPLQRGGPTLRKTTCQSVINAAGFTRVKTVQDMRLHTYMGDGRVTVVVENKGSKRSSLKLDCSKSKNCLINPPEATQTVTCLAGSSVVGFHLVPEDEDKEWTINCQEELLTS